MAMPSDYDINFYAGDTQAFIIRWKNPDGTPIDMTGLTALMQVVKTYKDAPLLSKTGALTLATGELEFSFTKEELTELLDASPLARLTLWYDLQLQNSDTETYIRTLLKGKVTIHEDYTRGGV